MFSKEDRRASAGRGRRGAVRAGLPCGRSPAGATTSNFVVGDGNATLGTHVTFWGAQWWKLNSLSGGTAPAAFKGFANELPKPSAAPAGRPIRATAPTRPKGPCRG